MTHRNPIRRDLDAANLQRRANFARTYDWLEIYWPRQEKPSIQAVDDRSEDHIEAIMRIVRELGGTCFRRHDKPLDLREV